MQEPSIQTASELPHRGTAAGLGPLPQLLAEQADGRTLAGSRFAAASVPWLPPFRSKADSCLAAEPGFLG